jgi:DNA-directed RNA polymerase I, II, and III subunit RPABC5
MIIPVKCFTCGNVLANKYRFYLDQVRKKKLSQQAKGSDIQMDKVLYLTKDFKDKTPEGETLDELSLNRLCCRRHLLTHVDIE